MPTDTLTPTDLELLTAEEREMWERCEKATRGPWDTGPKTGAGYVWVYSGNCCVAAPIFEARGGCAAFDKEAKQKAINAEFMAASRTAVPTLLRSLVAARREVEEMRKALEELIALRSAPRVTRQEPIHKYECPCWRIGKGHGPCNCGGDELAETVIAKAYENAIAAAALAGKDKQV